MMGKKNLIERFGRKQELTTHLAALPEKETVVNKKNIYSLY